MIGSGNWIIDNLNSALAMWNEQLSDNNERLKYILDVYFTKDEKELEEIYQYIDYEERYKLDIPIYCLLRLTENKIDIKSILTDDQYRLVIMYLALKVKKMI